MKLENSTKFNNENLWSEKDLTNLQNFFLFCVMHVKQQGLWLIWDEIISVDIFVSVGLST